MGRQGEPEGLRSEGDMTMGCELICELIQVQCGCLASWPDLDGFASAECEGCAASFAAGVGEFPLAAAGAARIRFAELAAVPVILPEIDCGEGAIDGGPLSEEDFQRFPGLRRSDHADHRTEHAGGITGRTTSSRTFTKQTLQARPRSDRFFPGGLSIGGAWENDSHASFRPDRSAIHVGSSELDGEIVEQVAGLKVVRAIDDHIAGFDERAGIASMQILYDRIDSDLRVDGSESLSGGFGFGPGLAGIGFIEKDLPLQIGPFDKVTIDEDQMAHASPDEELGAQGPEGAAADDEGGGVAESGLSRAADVGQEHLSMIAVVIGHERIV